MNLLREKMDGIPDHPSHDATSSDYRRLFLFRMPNRTRAIEIKPAPTANPVVAGSGTARLIILAGPYTAKYDWVMPVSPNFGDTPPDAGPPAGVVLMTWACT